MSHWSKSRPPKPYFVNGLAIAALILAAAPYRGSLAAEGAPRSTGWTLSADDQDHPGLSYSDGKKTVFLVACGRPFAIWAAYPDPSWRPKKATDKAYIAIENGKSQTNLTGVLQAGTSDDLPANTTYFFQSDLGYDHDSSSTYGPAWQKREARLFDFLESDRALTISGAGKAYVLPAIRIADWKARLKKVC